MKVLTPRSLGDALVLRADYPDALAIAGGTDVMVAMNFDRVRPPAVLDLSRVSELRGWRRDGAVMRLGATLTFSEVMEPPLSEILPALTEAARTVGSPQIRNRGTIGGNVGTCSPAGDALPPLLAYGAALELTSIRGTRSVPIDEFMIGPKQHVLAKDELITAISIPRVEGPQTFMKVGARSAMVIAVASLCLLVDRGRSQLRAAYGAAGPRARLVTAPLSEHATFPDRVANSSCPIDDMRGSAAYRRHALRVLTKRALERCLA